MLKIEGVNRVLAAGSGAMKTGEAGEFGVPLLTNLELAGMLVDML